MKTKLLTRAGGLLAAVSWLIHEPAPVRAEDIPEKYLGTISKGLEFLVKHQHADGRWEGDDGQHPVAMTALAGTALFMEMKLSRGQFVPGNSEGLKYRANVQRAADWLCKCQSERTGLFYSGHASETSRYMEGHGLATLFLAGLVEHETDKTRRQRLRKAIALAAHFIVRAQSSQGGWYHTAKAEGHDLDDALPTIIQTLALQAAFQQRIVIGNAFLGARAYLHKAAESYAARSKPAYDPANAAKIAGVINCRNWMDSVIPADDVHWKASQLAMREIPVGSSMKFGRDELAHYYHAQARYSAGMWHGHEKDWHDYRTATFDELQRRQNRDGSWPAGDGICRGQVYSTALWCTVLQLDNGSNPKQASLLPQD